MVQVRKWSCVLCAAVGAALLPGLAFATDPSTMPLSTDLQTAIDGKIWTYALVVLAVAAALFAYFTLVGYLRKRH